MAAADRQATGLRQVTIREWAVDFKTFTINDDSTYSA
jgi:hypothetical protein